MAYTTVKLSAVLSMLLL